LGLLKQFSSGDPITARFLYGKEFTYRPVGKLWFHGNSKPTIRASDEGTWRRVRLIPFTVTFKINQQDKNLDSKLIAESTGILNKFLLGLKNFQDLGSLDEPTAVTNAIADYRSSQDPLQDWLDECCYTHNPNSESLQPDLFRSFSAFRESQNASFRISDQSFSNLLDQKGFPRSRRISKGWLRSGITLKNHQEPYNPTSPPNIDKPTEEEARLFEHDD
jgi:putative DNA primase/helicase